MRKALAPSGLVFSVVFPVAFSAVFACKSAPPPSADAPPADAKPEASRTVQETIFGQTVSDDYRWLEDVKSADVQKWMDDQDKLARTHLAVLPGRDAVETRLKELYYVDDVSAPVVRKSRKFFKRQAKDSEKSVLYWQDKKGEPQVLIDPNTLSDDGSTSLGVWVPSNDGKYLAYGLKENNADESTLHVMEVATKKVSEIDVIPGAKYAEPAWTADGSGFFYTWLPVDEKIEVSERPGYQEVRFHRLGTKPSDDVTIHEKLGDPTRFIWPEISQDGRWLFVTIWHGWSQNDLYVRALKKGDKPEDAVFKDGNGWVTLAKGRDGHFEVRTLGDKLYISTNENTPRLKIYEVNGKNPGPIEKWKVLVPEDPEAVLKSFGIIGKKLVLNYMKNATSEIRVVDLKGKLVRKVALPALGTASGVLGRADDDRAYFTFSSFVYPKEVYETSIRTGKTKVYAKVDVPMKSDDFTVEQVWYPSKDGTKVSMFIVSKKGLKKSADTPALLYGYGGFNISLTPWYRARVIPWLERGGIYAVPNLRGGGEYGEAWHRAGMLHNKQNVFDDFIAAAEYLLKEGYTSSDKLAISGRSNGGLLVGAAMTQRPDLFRAVICGVPLLDMVRYHLFGSGKTWIPEYGDPEKKEDFLALLAYSPYHRVEKGTKYPALLMASADTDDRVDPMHARKFVARVQAAGPSAGAQLLRIERNAGHGGADLRKSAVAQFADEIAFLMSELSVSP